jgi:superfamily I DNA/RNA helicase/mRNA-degrading endonuclease RelE of RelBE toxin-antitoxin system
MNDRAKVRVAISADFLKAYSKVSKDRQTRVRSFIEKFKANPTASSLNYEKIANAADPNIRSLRVDRQYRAIVLKPGQGNVCMLLWVDNHDDAYEWAAKRQFRIHPDTGALQVVDVMEGASKAAAPSAPKKACLFDSIRDRELRRLGVPESLLPLVRSLHSDEDLEASVVSLPQEAYEALVMLAAGYSVEEAERELERTSKVGVDTEDFSAALDNADTRRRFVIVNDDYELQQMLAAPLEQWRVFLHPSQRKIAEMNANGPVRLLGGAGTGKTVVAMHRVKWLADHIAGANNGKILFTTFTRNLATDIRESLHSIADTAAIRKIEVINIDAWVSHFLRQNGYEYHIVFGDDLEQIWQSALNQAPVNLSLDDQFYRDEWEKVIQAQGITDRQDYVKASRTGRGRRLSRPERLDVWAVFEEYRALLNERRWRELTDAVRDARSIIETRGHVLPYVAVVVDEAQDMSPEVYRLIRQIVPASANDIFITGDAHQRIYAQKVVLSHCGIDIRGRSRRLRVNYRTSEQTRKWAVALLEGRPFDDLDGGSDDQRGYKSLLQGPEPQITGYGDFAAECEALVKRINELVAAGATLTSVCVVARTNDLLAQYDGALASSGIDTYRIKRSSADNRRKPGVRLATMHRVKGLEFDHVLVVGVNDGIVPLSAAMLADNPHEEMEGETRERALLYVAATRAKHSLCVSSYARPSPFLKA